MAEGKAKTAVKVKASGDSREHRVQVAVTADTNRLVPLANGNYVFYFDPLTSKCLHLSTHTTAFAEALRPACELGLGPRIRRELEGFDARWPDNNWDQVLADLVDDRVIE
jgi:hypothetical protein